MVVAILKGYVEWLHLPLGDYEIARLAYEIERKDVGLNGGKQDQYATIFGGFNFMEFYEKDRVIINPLRIKNWILDELESSLILCFTGTSRDSKNIINEQADRIKSNDKVSLNATHSVKESSKLMKEAILKGDIKLLAKIMEQAWTFKKNMSPSISNNLIDEMYKKAIDSGAYAGKISGAGGGGFIVFLVNPIKRYKVISALEEVGGKIENFHFVKHGVKSWVIYE